MKPAKNTSCEKYMQRMQYLRWMAVWMTSEETQCDGRGSLLPCLEVNTSLTFCRFPVLSSYLSVQSKEGMYTCRDTACSKADGFSMRCRPKSSETSQTNNRNPPVDKFLKFLQNFVKLRKLASRTSLNFFLQLTKLQNLTRQKNTIKNSEW